MSDSNYGIVVPTLCPHCNGRINAAYSACGGSSPPIPGDGSACGTCGGLLMFDQDLAMQAMTDERWAALCPDIRAELEAIQTWIRNQSSGDGGTGGG